MKTFWVDVRSCGKECATTAIEQGADALVAAEATPLHALGRVNVIAPDGDMILGTDVHEVCIDGKEGEEDALRFAEKTPVIVTTTDWSVIPLENLVSQSDRIIAAVRNADEAQMALTVLERGRIGEIYNVGGNNEKANIDIVKYILEVVGKSESLIAHVKDRPGHDKRYAIDNTKITTELGWSPEVTVDEGMKKTVSCYLDNKLWIASVTDGSYREYYEKMYGRV